MGTVRRAIKQDARAALKSRMGTAVLITLLLAAVGFVVGLFEGAIPLMLGAPTFFENLAQSENPWQAALSSAPWFLLYFCLTGILSAIFTAPMTVGTADWYMESTDGQTHDAGHIFWPFGCKKFWGSLVLYLAAALVSLFWTVLFLALPLVLIGYAVYSLYYLNLTPILQTMTVVGLLAGVLFLLVVLVFLAVFLTRYVPAIFLMGKRYGKGPLGALRMSAKITKGHRFQTFGFLLSFLPWMLLNILVIPMFFTIPYAAMSAALYTRYLAELYENKGQTPMTLPAYDEGPALPDVELEGLEEEALPAEVLQPAPEAEVVPEADEWAETLAEKAAEPAETVKTAEAEIVETEFVEEEPLNL